MSLKSTVLYNTGIQVVGRAVTTLFSLVSIGFITRYLGTEGYGAYTTVFAYTGLFFALSALGLNPIAVREMSKDEHKIGSILGNLFSLRLFLSLTVFFAAFILSFAFSYPKEVRAGVSIIFFSLFFAGLTETLTTLFQTKLKLSFPTFADVFGRLGVLLAVVFAVRMDLGLTAVFAAYVLGHFLTFITNFLLSLRLVSFKPQVDLRVWKYLISTSWIFGIAAFISVIIFKIDSILLSLLPIKSSITNFEAVGIYGVPYRIFEFVMLVPGMFMATAFPILSKGMSISKEEGNRIFQLSFDFLTALAVPMVFGIFSLAPYIVDVIAGKEFALSVVPLRILSVSVALTFTMVAVGRALISAGLQNKLLWASTSMLVFNVIANIIFIPRYTYIGASVVSVATMLLGLILHLYFLRFNLSMFPRLRFAGLSLLSSVLMFLFLEGVKQLGVFSAWSGMVLPVKLILLMLVALIGALIYLLNLILTRAVDRELIKESLGVGPKVL